MATQPVGKDRPRLNRKTGSIYTPTRSQHAEWAIRQEWEKMPVVFSTPVRLRVEANFVRPQSHIGAKGLTAAGRRGGRELGPVGKPDADNILKTVMDALNGYAFQDDASVLEATIVKRWGDTPSLLITVEDV